MTTYNSYEKRFDILSKSFTSGYTTTFNNHFANMTSINEAVFLAWFVWMWNTKAKNGEMFLVEHDFHTRTSIPIHGFRKVVKKWEKLGIIATHKKGIPMKKYYRLNKEKLVDYYESVMAKTSEITVCEQSLEISRDISLDPQEISSEEQQRYISIKQEEKINKKDNSRSEQAPSRKRTVSNDGIFHDKTSPTLFPQKRTTRQSKVLSDKDIKQQRIAMKVATKLKFALAHHKWITWTPNLNKWVKDIIKLRKSDLVKVTFKDMFVAVQYLKDHGEEQWCPKVCNAAQFGSKYGSILDAIQRTNGEKIDSKNQHNGSGSSYDCPEAELIPQNLCKGAKCSHCKSSDVKVYEVLPPDGSFNLVKICKKCYRKWQKQIEEDQQYDDIE